MNQVQKKTLLKNLKKSFGVLLIVLLLLNMLFVAMGKIGLIDFWIFVAFIGGVAFLFYRDQDYKDYVNSTKQKNK